MCFDLSSGSVNARFKASCDLFFENILNKSFFETKKLIIISRASDKILKIIQEIVEKEIIIGRVNIVTMLTNAV